jgi:hypothetical protein
MGPNWKRNHNLKVRYGITAVEYDRRLSEQDGRCAICKEEPTCRGLFVDHHHGSGAVRELLCGRCNNVLGWVGESQELLSRLAAYLEKWHPRGE